MSEREIGGANQARGTTNRLRHEQHPKAQVMRREGAKRYVKKGAGNNCNVSKHQVNPPGHEERIEAKMAEVDAALKANVEGKAIVKQRKARPRLTESEVMEVRRLLEAGLSLERIGRLMGMHRSTAGGVSNGSLYAGIGAGPLLPLTGSEQASIEARMAWTRTAGQHAQAEG